MSTTRLSQSAEGARQALAELAETMNGILGTLKWDAEFLRDRIEKAHPEAIELELRAALIEQFEQQAFTAEHMQNFVHIISRAVSDLFESLATNGEKSNANS